jgi:HD-like signal output (HDOD) protein
MSASRSAVLDRIDDLPAMPAVTRDLMAEFDKPDVDIDRVTRLVNHDPVLTMKLLRLANSSFYARKGTVDRLQDAIVYIGTHATRNLVLSVGLAASVKFPEGFPQDVFWRYSLHSAVAARHIAACGRRDGSTAFTLGLMRAIGEPLVVSACGAQLREVDRGCAFYGSRRVDAERAALGFSYVDVTAEIAERWHFPESMVEAIRASSSESATAAPMAAIVGVGAWVAGEAEAGRGVAHGVPQVITEQMRSAKLSDDIFDSMPPVRELARGLETLLH